MTYEEAIEILQEERGQRSYVNKALDMAKAALEKRIPKKPVSNKCPICNAYIATRYAEYKPPCCKHCGQALDWSW